MRKFLIPAVLLISAALGAHADQRGPTLLDNGYAQMYNLQFAEAHESFARWQAQHPEDPLGPVSDAAAYLFAEFDRLHVLEMELFTDDSRFEQRSKQSPDAQVKKAFSEQLVKARGLASQALAKNPRDANALLASVLSAGLEGDYLAMIEKRELQGLKFIKQGRATAEQLLTIDPGCYDAYLAVGVENYLLSLKPAPLRWFLRLGGAQTDKDTGLQKLRITADKGHYLMPYARLLLAVAALRDHDRARARLLLEELARQYPHNHLYGQELAKLR
ncbi:MAG: hypothetical protein ACR2IF_03035 [Terriglobales bacterium]